MGKHVAPNPSQLAEDRHEKSLIDKSLIQNYSDPIYKIRSAWYGILKRIDEFEIAFTVDTDTEQVYEALNRAFGDLIDNYSRWMYLYTVNLKIKLTWDEIIIRVNHALKDVIFDVIG